MLTSYAKQGTHKSSISCAVLEISSTVFVLCATATKEMVRQLLSSSTAAGTSCYTGHPCLLLDAVRTSCRAASSRLGRGAAKEGATGTSHRGRRRRCVWTASPSAAASPWSTPSPSATGTSRAWSTTPARGAGKAATPTSWVQIIVVSTLRQKSSDELHLHAMCAYAC